MRPSSHNLWGVCALLVVLPLPQKIEEEHRISTNVDLVVLPVTVRDRNRSFVSGLPQDSFQVFEDHRPQKIRLFQQEDLPVTVGLVMDTSASVSPKRSDMIAAARIFIEASNREDEMFVVSFNENVRMALPEETPFSSDAEQLQGALRRFPPRGRTALYDAIDAALEHLEKGRRERKALIVFSDGGDNASDRTFQEVLKKALQSTATIYTIGLFDEQDHDRNPDVLKRLAKITGGEAFIPEELSEVGNICRQIARDLRNRYTIGYTPSQGNGERAYRSIQVTAAAPDRRKLSVRTRTGYLIPN
jgi:Ca-activated chloride channel family protein